MTLPELRARRVPPSGINAGLEVVRRLGPLALILVVWYIGAFLLSASGDPTAGSKLPYPHVVAARFLAAFGTVAESAWTTASRAVVGFLIGAAISIGFAVLMVQARWVEAAFMPYLLAVQMVPLIALVPILRAVFKDADLTRLYISSFVTFFVVTIATLRGLKNTSPPAIELMDSLDASRLATLRHLQFPSALPFIFSGLRVAAPLSLIGAILVDLLGARTGLGYLMVASLALGGQQTVMLWVALVTTLSLGLVFTRIVALVERRLTFWAPAFRGSAS